MKTKTQTNLESRLTIDLCEKEVQHLNNILNLSMKSIDEQSPMGIFRGKLKTLVAGFVRETSDLKNHVEEFESELTEGIKDDS